MIKKVLTGLGATCVFIALHAHAAYASTSDVVLYASDATNVHGNWTLVPEPSAAGGQLISSVDKGWSATDAPQAAPAHYFDFTFDAAANTPYRVWLRVRPAGNSKYNDSLYAQFSDAVDAGAAALYRIGSTNALTVNLATNAGASSLKGWGWQDGAYWLTQATTIQFAATGRHTLRIQTREDGVQLDQVVLSPATFLSIPPGGVTNDSTIVRRSAASQPFTSSPLALPGTIEAEDFDNGGQGVAHNDITAGNSGGAYRQTDVDLQASTENAYNVGWISAGEWLKYSIKVDSAGVYMLEARVASRGQGGTFHVEVGGADVTGALTIPDTAGWQNWTTVSKAITLPAGDQVMRVVFDTSGPNAVGNLNWLRASLVLPPPAAPGTQAPIQGAVDVTTNTNLTWSAPGATSYDVSFGTTNPPAPVASGLTSPSYIPGVLARSTTYYWRVVARNAGGDTAGPVWSFTTVPPPPAMPVQAPADGTTRVAASVSLSWSAASATSYDLNFGTTTPPARMLTGTEASSYSPATLADGTTYYWQAIAHNSGGTTAGPIASFTTVPKPVSSPFTGTPLALPGTIEAEDFDNGGQGLAYNDVTTINSGGAYRQTAVDLEPSTENGYNVGWISVGEWLKYSVNVNSGGTYLLEARVASLGQGGTFHVEVGSTDVTGALTIPDTGGWQTWTTISKAVALPAGNQVLRVVFDTSVAKVGNLNWLRVSPISSPFSGTPFAVPGTIEAEDFDNGGQGVAYNDITTGNAGGAYRQTGVDLQASTEHGYNVGWIDVGEWLQYSVKVASGGTYLLEARVASRGPGGTFHVEVGGSDITGALTIPDTGGWQQWATVAKAVTLPAGSQVLRVVFDTTAPSAVGNLNWLRVSPLVLPPPAPAKPGAPTAPAPTDGATGISTNPTTLAWSASGATSYDIRFGTSNPPPPAATGLLTPSYAPPMTNSTTYYWQVIAHNAVGSTTGPVWSFTTTAGSGSGTTWMVPAGGDLQAAINNAQLGDTILLQAGATFTGDFVLPAKTGDAFITIRSSADDALLPGPNTRIDPSYAHLLPKLKSPGTEPSLRTAPGAHHYRLMFLEFPPTYQGFYNIIRLGDGSSAQNTLSMVPYELVLDRVYVHGDPVYGQKNGIALNSASTSVLNSYISGIRAIGQDSQAIGGTNGPGPFTIVNNYLEAAGENIMFGGADPAIPNLVPSDILIRGNHLYKPLAWRSEPKWTVKNLFELKNAQRVVVDGNVMENNWLASQTGYAILFTPRNQDGRCPWCVVQDVQFTNNVVRNVASGINILGRDNNFPSLETNNIIVRNNVFENVSGSAFGGQGRFLLMTGGGHHYTFDHNTVLQDGWSAVFVGSPVQNFVFTNNIVPDYSWAILGEATAAGNATIQAFFPYSTFRGNIFAGSDPARYPSGNHYPASMAGVGFVNYIPLTGGNYRLGLTSLYRNAGNDGADVGVNTDALNAAGISY